MLYPLLALCPMLDSFMISLLLLVFHLCLISSTMRYGFSNDIVIAQCACRLPNKCGIGRSSNSLSLYHFQCISPSTVHWNSRERVTSPVASAIFLKFNFDSRHTLFSFVARLDLCGRLTHCCAFYYCRLYRVSYLCKAFITN